MTTFSGHRVVLAVGLLLAGPFLAPIVNAELDVDVDGVSGEILENVEAFLSIHKAASRNSDENAALSDFAVNRLHAKSEKEITEALMPFGYYSPTVEASLENRAGDWKARYLIQKGPPTLIASVTLHVDAPLDNLLEIRRLIDQTPIRSGEVLNHKHYSELKQGLLQIAISQGYLDARYREAEIRVEPAARVASVSLDMDIGQLFTFGLVSLDQNALDQSFAERYVSVKEGEPFSTEQLVAMQFALSDSGYFENVAVTANREAVVDGKIPVVVEAKARKSSRYVARIGAGTDTGPRVRLGTEFRRLSGRGTRFRSDLQVSAIKTSATAEYSFPIKNVATDRQAFSGSFERAQIGDTDSDLYSLGARRYDHWNGLRRQLYVEFENELFTLGNQSDVRSELLVFGASLAYQKVDDAIFTRRGVTARLDIHGAQESLLSDTSFAQATLATRAIYPLGNRGRLLLRADLGVTEVDQLADLPPSQRFFTGGDRTIRGYGFEELSPVDADGLDVGGRYLIAASVETDYFFNDKYGVAVFFDHGNAVNSLDDALKSGYGIGIRYRTPIGVLRIDGARPLDRTDDTFRLHISLGPDS